MDASVDINSAEPAPPPRAVGGAWRRWREQGSGAG